MCSRSTASIAILPRSGITNFFTSQRQASTERGLAPDLDMLGQIPLGELGDGGRRRGLRGIGVGVFPGLDAGDYLGRLGAGLFRRDDAVAADRDPLRLSARPRLDDVHLGTGGIHAHAEALQFAVPVDGVLVAHRQCVDGAVRNGPVFEPGHVFPNPVCG